MYEILATWIICKYHFVGDMNAHNEKLLMLPNRRQEWELLMKNKWGKFNEHHNYTHATYTQRKMKIVPHGCNLCITSKQSYKDKHFLQMPTMMCALFVTNYQVFFNIVICGIFISRCSHEMCTIPSPWSTTL
jgi:hypothetical protein